MNEHIRKIVSDPMPECDAKGHRVHVTSRDEDWPEWSKVIYGIAGGFIHFENEEDYGDWRSCQPSKTIEKKSRVSNAHDIGGRCVTECGPIGFKSAA